MAGLDRSRRCSVLLVAERTADAVPLMAAMAAAPRTTFLLSLAASVDDACAHLRASEVDAVVIDLWADAGSGVGAVGRLRDAAGNVPVVALVESRLAEVGEVVVEDGADDYLVKEHTSPEVVERVLRHAVERRRLLARVEHAERVGRRTLDHTTQVSRPGGKEHR